ncbi:MAG TPA: FxsA family protein [Kofleriaceae bacterium]|nr:FxsA family protein [Kofleriaceae bacterium]
MRLFLVLLLLAAPVLDLFLLIVIGRHIGVWPVVAFVVASGFLGGRLARHQGRRVVRDLEAARRAGQVPREGLLSAGLLSLAGVLLVVPGAVSTLCGLALLVPAARRLLSRWARGWFERRLGVVAAPAGDPLDSPAELRGSRPGPAGSGQVIDIDDDGRPVN